MVKFSCILCGEELSSTNSFQLEKDTTLGTFINLFNLTHSSFQNVNSDESLFDSDAFLFCKTCHCQISEVYDTYRELDRIMDKISNLKKDFRSKLMTASKAGIAKGLVTTPSWRMRKSILERFGLIVTARTPNPTPPKLTDKTPTNHNRIIKVSPGPPVVNDTPLPSVQQNNDADDSDWPFPEDLGSNQEPDPPIGTIVHSDKWVRPRVFGRFPCGVCDKVFKYKETRRHHMEIHRKDKDRTCSACGTVFQSRKRLLVHFGREHGENRFNRCTECGKEFKTKYCLRVHLISHSTERPYVCCHCGKAFKHESPFRKHEANHEVSEVQAPGFEGPSTEKEGPSPSRTKNQSKKPVRRFPCPEPLCSQALASKVGLRNHLKAIHRTELLFPCTRCAQAFKTKYQLVLHKASHAQERPHACTHCDKAFKLPSLLQEHELTHSEERPYKCPQCDKAFPRARYLKCHSVVHSDELKHVCTKCRKKFKHYLSMRRHSKQCTGTFC